jgi:hypothetical protein
MGHAQEAKAVQRAPNAVSTQPLRRCYIVIENGENVAGHSNLLDRAMQALYSRHSTLWQKTLPTPNIMGST